MPTARVGTTIDEEWSEPILPDTEESQLLGKGGKAASNSAGGT
jgi:hypothetical protein